MSATDNAFIKAYAEDLTDQGGTERTTVRHTRHLEMSKSKRKTRGVRMATLYNQASVGVLREDPDPRDADDEPYTHHSLVSSAVEPPPARVYEPGVVEVGEPIDLPDFPQLRVDSPATVPTEGHSPPQPTISPPTDSEDQQPAAGRDVSQWRADDALSVSEAPAVDGEFRPQWEVDRLRWPAIVEQLMDSHSGPLARIIDTLTATRDQSNVVGITSYGRGEGRSTMALTLARLSAQRGHTVALVDGDFSSPNLAESISVSIESGWTEVGSDPAGLSEAAVQSLEDGLCVLLLRDEGRRPDGADIGNVLLALSRAFDMVLVDVGPMYLAAASWFDRCVGTPISRALVVRDIRTASEPQVDDVIERLAHRDVNTLGIVENFEHSVESE